jgi:hypothetical protein
MQKKQLPKSITIFGHRFKIVVKPLEGDHGRSDVDSKTIYVDSTIPYTEQETTLAHEALHMVLDLGGLGFMMTDDVNEAIVRCLEYGFLPLVELK